MPKILYSDEIASDRIKKYKPINKGLSSFRVYLPDPQGKIKGLWIDKGKIYKDRIRWVYFKDYQSALNKSKNLLNSSKELCISLEDCINHKLYFIYKDKIEVARVLETKKTIYKKTSRLFIKDFLDRNGGLTYYKDKGYYRIFSYK